MRPFAAPGLTSIDFLRPRGTPKVDPFLGPLKIDPVGDKVAPWPPFGRQWLHFACFLDPFWEPIFIIFRYFSEPLKTWFLQYLTAFLKVLAIQKLSFWDPFSITFSTPFWDPLWKSLLAHLGRQRCRPCLPMSILVSFWDPPWIQNGTLERPGAPRKCKKNQLPESRIASRDRHGSDPCPKGVP